MKLSAVPFFFENTRKNFESTLVLVLVLVLKSKALYQPKVRECFLQCWLRVRLVRCHVKLNHGTILGALAFLYWLLSGLPRD